MSDREKMMQLIDEVPEYKIRFVIAYLQGLTADKHDPSDEENYSVKSKRRLGLLSDKFHFVSDDFDETPECFKEYVQRYRVPGTFSE